MKHCLPCARIYTAIDAYMEEHGYAPTLRDIARLTGITTISVVGYHLEHLREKNLITWQRHLPRTIRIKEKAS